MSYISVTWGEKILIALMECEEGKKNCCSLAASLFTHPSKVEYKVVNLNKFMFLPCCCLLGLAFYKCRPGFQPQFVR